MLDKIRRWWMCESDPWKAAVIETAIVEGTYTADDEDDPAGAISKIMGSVARVAECPEGNPKIRAMVEELDRLKACASINPTDEQVEALAKKLYETPDASGQFRSWELAVDWMKKTYAAEARSAYARIAALVRPIPGRGPR